ncbi:MAG: TRAP transporter small permease [Pararhodobacter sp.]|nr:TRAP transporter small permease [Pararhodobacter sp.]
MRTITLAIDRMSFVLSWAGAIGTAIALLAMMLHISADALSRWLFNNPFPGTLEIVSYYYMVAVVFLPLAMVQRMREHIRVDILAQVYGKRTLRVLDAIAGTMVTGFAVAFAWASVETALRQTRRGAWRDVTFFDLEIWQSYWFMVAGGVFLAVAALAVLLNDLVFGPPPPDQPEDQMPSGPRA